MFEEVLNMAENTKQGWHYSEILFIFLAKSDGISGGHTL